MPTKKTVLIDFDGVLASYDGWKGEEELGQPLDKVRHACALLSKDFKLVCFTTRGGQFVEPWLREHGLAPFFDGVTSIKIPAFCMIDDRVVEFKGEWNDELIARVRAFKPWWEKDSFEL